MIHPKLLMVTVLLGILFIAGCSSQVNYSKDPLSIGIITPLSGRLAIIGETTQNSVQLALEEINKEGGINGRPLTVIFEDSKANSKEAASAAHKLIDQYKVPLIMDVATSGEAAVIASIAEPSKVIHYSVLATTEALVDAGEYIFKMREGAIPHTKEITSVMKQKNIDEIAVIHLADEYCTNTVAQFSKQASQRGIKVSLIAKYQVDDTDYRAQITKAKQSSADGVYVCGFYKDLGLVFKQMYELNLNKPKFSVTTFEHPLVKKNAGTDAIEGTIYSVSPLDCQESKEFCKKYQARYGHQPDYRAAFAYDAVKIIAKALEQGTNPDKLKDTLLRIQHAGATGLTYFDNHGNSIKDVVVHEVVDGEWVAYSS